MNCLYDLAPEERGSCRMLHAINVYLINGIEMMRAGGLAGRMGLAGRRKCFFVCGV